LRHDASHLREGAALAAETLHAPVLIDVRGEAVNGLRRFGTVTYITMIEMIERATPGSPTGEVIGRMQPA
jgi:hypothetical protein